MLAVWSFFLLVPVDLNGQDSRNELDLLRKVSAAYIGEVLDSAESIEDAAETIGITPDELRRLCRSLSINIARFEPVFDPYSVPSAQMILSAGYEPDAVVSYNWTTPYLLLVEKSSHTLFLLQYKNGVKTLLGAYDCKTGKIQGDKREEGDHKTPEGVYFLRNKYGRDEIRKLVGASNAYQYGDMAFATDFPNNIDRMNGKNGSGIWLHGTDEPFSETSALDTRGCVVTTNETIRTLSEYISLRRTPLIIVEDLEFSTTTEHAAKQRELLDMLDHWRRSWAGKRMDDYMGHYSEKFRSSGRNKTQLREFKSLIFGAHTINHIIIDNIIMLKHNGGMIAKFNQDYSASNIKSKNIKELFFMKNTNTGAWEIISERTTN